MSERKLHRLGKEPENGFLFLLFADAHDLVAAERAEFKKFSTAAAHASHAIVAHDFFAKRASMRDGRRRMPRAKQFAILENDWRRFENGNFDFRNGDVYIRRFHENLNITDEEGLAGHKTRFVYRLAINERSVSGLAIADNKFAAVQFQFTMETRNRRMNYL